MVWWQGYSDMINGIYNNNYYSNLQLLFTKIRTTLKIPTLPIVVVELGISGTNNRFVSTMEYQIRQQQQDVCTSMDNFLLVPTSYIVDQHQLHTTNDSSKTNSNGSNKQQQQHQQ
jgi:Carbohydrate esterase, sialic acid-specific acetylesterase